MTNTVVLADRKMWAGANSKDNKKVWSHFLFLLLGYYSLNILFWKGGGACRITGYYTDIRLNADSVGSSGWPISV